MKTQLKKNASTSSSDPKTADSHGWISTETVKTRFGNFKFKNGYPTPAAANALLDQLKFNRAIDVYLTQIPAVGIIESRRGIRDFGAKRSNQVVIWESLMDAETLARETWDFYEHHQNVMRGMVATNELSAPVAAIIPGLKPDIGESPLLYGFGFFALEPDEAWLIECDVPAEGHWSFQLYSRWYESLEFQHRQSSINRTQALIDDDGRFRAVVSATDPGTVNWIDSEGHLQGCLIYRWLRCNVTPTATARAVKLSNLAELLPSKHFDLDARRRSEALSSRARHFSHLYQS